MEKNKLGLKLLELRQNRGLSQKKLCGDLNISRASYSYFENGRRMPDVSTLIMIAQYYGVSMNELLGLGDSSAGMPICDTGVSLMHRLKSKHIPIENIMEMTKADYDFLMEYKKLTPDNQEEIKYLMAYKLRKQSC